jgi:predicted nucleotidyltransferase
MTSKTEIISFLKSHKNEFKEKFGVEKIGLFGSYARNEANENSDIDIVIESNQKDFENREKLRIFLESYFGISVDIGYLSSLRGFIREEISKELVYV